MSINLENLQTDSFNYLSTNFLEQIDLRRLLGVSKAFYQKSLEVIILNEKHKLTTFLDNVITTVSEFKDGEKTRLKNLNISILNNFTGFPSLFLLQQGIYSVKNQIGSILANFLKGFDDIDQSSFREITLPPSLAPISQISCAHKKLINSLDQKWALRDLARAGDFDGVHTNHISTPHQLLEIIKILARDGDILEAEKYADLIEDSKLRSLAAKAIAIAKARIDDIDEVLLSVEDTIPEEGIRLQAKAIICSVAGQFTRAIDFALEIDPLKDRADALIQIIKDINRAEEDIRKFPEILNELTNAPFEEAGQGNISYEIAMAFVRIKEYEDAIKFGMIDSYDYFRPSALTAIAITVIRDQAIHQALDYNGPPSPRWADTVFFQMCNAVNQTKEFGIMDDVTMDKLINLMKRSYPPDLLEERLIKMIQTGESRKDPEIQSRVLMQISIALARAGYDDLARGAADEIRDEGIRQNAWDAISLTLKCK